MEVALSHSENIMNNLIFKHVVSLFEDCVKKGLNFSIQHDDEWFCISIYKIIGDDQRNIGGVVNFFYLNNESESIRLIRELKLLVAEYE